MAQWNASEYIYENVDCRIYLNLKIEQSTPI